METNPEYIHVREGYNLGKIYRSYTSDNGELIKDSEIEVLVNYEKVTLHKNSEFILGEHVSFRDPYNRIHKYFSYHKIYRGTISKWTKNNGEIMRELRKRDYTKEPLDLNKFEKDILDKLKNLPNHVKNVFGI